MRPSRAPGCQNCPHYIPPSLCIGSPHESGEWLTWLELNYILKKQKNTSPQQALTRSDYLTLLFYDLLKDFNWRRCSSVWIFPQKVGEYLCSEALLWLNGTIKHSGRHSDWVSCPPPSVWGRAPNLIGHPALTGPPLIQNSRNPAKKARVSAICQGFNIIFLISSNDLNEEPKVSCWLTKPTCLLHGSSIYYGGGLSVC